MVRIVYRETIKKLNADLEDQASSRSTSKRNLSWVYLSFLSCPQITSQSIAALRRQ